jgi:F0F1-type ATP synthase membrane subunit b/b'
MRQKRIGADIHEAVRLLIDLLELQQTHEQRLAQARIHRREFGGFFVPRL